MRVRHQAPIDVLGNELGRLRGTDDAFVVEATFTVLVDQLDPRGHTRDPAFERFCRAAVGDPRSSTTTVGVTAMAVLAGMGHPAVRPDAAASVAAASADLTMGLPLWHTALGQVHVVEAGALRTADGLETVLHVMLDYDVEGAGARHLLTVASESSESRVHLMDVRGREDEDSLEPVAARYSDPTGPTWTWVAVDSLAAVVEESGAAGAVRDTGQRSARQWPVVDVESAPTLAWALGVRRLAHVTGLDLEPSRSG